MIRYPLVESRHTSFVRICEAMANRQERTLLRLSEEGEYAALDFGPGVAVSAIGGVVSKAYGLFKRAIGGAIAWMDTINFPTTALLDKLPKWQADNAKIRAALLKWGGEIDGELAPLGIRVSGAGFDIKPFEQLPRGYRDVAHKYLTPSGGGGYIAKAEKVFLQHSAFVTRVIEQMLRVASTKGAELPDGASQQLDEVAGMVDSSLAMLSQVVAAIKSAGAALARVKATDTDGLQSGVAAVVEPLDKLLDTLEAMSLEVDTLMDRLVHGVDFDDEGAAVGEPGIPASVPAPGVLGRAARAVGFPDAQTRAATRYTRGVQQADFPDGADSADARIDNFYRRTGLRQRP